jgi:putative acetyltransferase
MRSADSRAFLEAHHAAVRGAAVADYPLAVIEARAPMPVTEEACEQARANRENEYRLIAEIDGQVVGIGALAVESCELRACYVAPSAGRRGSGPRSSTKLKALDVSEGSACSNSTLQLRPKRSIANRVMRYANPVSTFFTTGNAWLA